MIICPNLSNPDVAREFNELKNATSEAAAYHIWSLNNGNGIDKAPNGAESKLFLSLLEHYNGDRVKAIQAKAKTYGMSFLKWFGNWTGQEGVLPEYEESNSVSKVVDENGEPLVVYHSNDSEKFDSNRQYSWFSSKRQTYYGNRQYPVFLNVKNLFKRDNPTMEERAMITDYGAGNKYDKLPKEYDGAMVYHKTFGYYELLTTRNSNQAKSIDNEGPTPYEGTFSTKNNDIYRNVLKENDYISMLDELELSREKVENFIDNFYSKVLKVNPRYKIDESTEYFAWKNRDGKYFFNFDKPNKLASKIFGYNVEFDWNNKEDLLEDIDKELDNWYNNLQNIINNPIDLSLQYKEKYKILNIIKLLTRYLKSNISLNDKEKDEVFKYLNTINQNNNKPVDNRRIGYQIQKLKEQLSSINILIQDSTYKRYAIILAAKNRIVAMNIINNIKQIIKERLLAEYDSYQIKDSSYEEKIKPVLKLAKKLESVINSSNADRLTNELFENTDQKEASYDYLYNIISKKYPQFKPLLLLFRNANPKLKIKIGGDPERFITGIVPGKFHPKTNTLILYNGCDIYTTIHELAHSATFFGMIGLSEKLKPFAELIEKFMDYIRNYIKDKQLSPSLLRQGNIMGVSVPADVYGFTNPSEFIAELYGNPAFAEFLDEIPAMENKQFKSLLHQIWDSIINFLNNIIGKNKLDKTALDLAKKLGLTCIYLQQEHINDIYNQLEEITKSNSSSFSEQNIILSSHPENYTQEEWDQEMYNGINLYEELQRLYREYLDEYLLLLNMSSFVDSSVQEFISENPDASNNDILEQAAIATVNWADQRQREIMGQTQLQLAQAFGLIQQEDGSWSTESTDPTDRLRVEFVNSLGNPGQYDHAHHTISIGMLEGDSTTFNHELAHYYIRTFWNSRAVQNALKIVYDKKTMGSDINDPKTREAIEEALVDFMTKRSVDDMFKSDIEHMSPFKRFWQDFNAMLYKVFRIKTETAQQRLLDQITMSFLVNEQLKNNVRANDISMFEGVVNQSEYQKRRAKNRDDRVTYQKHNLYREDENATFNIISATQSKAKSYEYRSAASQLNSVYNDTNQRALNQEAVRQVRQSANLIMDAVAQGDAVTELHEKAKLFMGFIERSEEEVTRVNEMFANAAANDYKKVMYNEDIQGNKSYMTGLSGAGEQITDANATADTKSQEFSFSDLQYAAQDVIGFINPLMQAIKKILEQALSLGFSDQDIIDLEEKIQNSGIENKISILGTRYEVALLKRLYNWIDDVIQLRDELDEDHKQRLRVNMRKWLTDQMSFGDVSVMEKWIGMGSHSKSPIIRAIQDFINEMQNERDNVIYEEGIALMDQLRKAKNEAGAKYRILPYNMQKMLMLLDRRGLPTGYFISEINRGQYLQDIENKRSELLFGKNGLERKLKDLRDDAGNPIYVDTDGKPIKKLEFDMYGFPIAPQIEQCDKLIKDYLIEMEKFKCERSERRFTEKYYVERIQCLTVSALRALNAADRKILGITEAVTINGVPRIDLLTNSQRADLEAFELERRYLGSIYNSDGSLKVVDSEEYDIAMSIREFRARTRGKISYNVNWDQYEEAKSHAKNQQEFERKNSTWQVNPAIWFNINMMYSNELDETDPDVINLSKLQYDKSILVSQLQGHQVGEMKWDKLYDSRVGIKNEQLWKTLRELDERIDEAKAIVASKYERHKLDKNFDFRSVMEKVMIPMDRGGDWHSEHTVYNHIKTVIDDVLNNDTSLTAAERQAKRIEWMSLLEYYSVKEDMDQPLNIFNYFLPTDRNAVVIGHQTIESFVRMPTLSVFNQVDKIGSSSEYVNKNYDEKDSNFEQPKRSLYEDQRYKKYIKGNPEIEKLLEMCQSKMDEYWQKIPFLGKYDGRLSQIGARTGQILGRRAGMKFGLRFLKNIGEFLRREFEVVETDIEFAPDGDRQRRADGDEIKNIPIRFVRMLDNPEYISADIVGSVLKFMDMAENYSIKAKKSPLLTQLFAKLRASDSHWYTGGQGEVLKGMMSRLIYEDNTKGFGSETSNEPFIEEEWKHFDWVRKYVISTKSSWFKRVKNARISMQLGLLALNITSGIVSFLDPLTSLIIDSATGKYINVFDDIYAIRKLFGNFVGNLTSLGKVKSNGKLAAAMQRMQLSKSNISTFSDTDLGQIMRFISDGLNMKHFTFGDYTINSINVIATMHNYRAYKDNNGVIKFYPKNLFIKKAMEDGKAYKEAKRDYRKAVNMWQSCKVNRKNGKFEPNDSEYGKAIDDATFNAVKKQVRSRSSLYNGIVNDTERTRFQVNVWGGFITMVRNFMITGIMERFKNLRDFQVDTFDVHGNPSDENVAYTIPKREVKRTQRYYKGGANFDTRRIEDGLYNNFLQFVRSVGPYMMFILKSLGRGYIYNQYNPKHKLYMMENNLNDNVLYYIQRTQLELLSIIALMILSIALAKAADDDDDNYWLQLLSLITIRLEIERMTWFRPSTFMELIQSPTAALSDYKRKLKVFDLFFDATGLSSHSLDEEMSKRSSFAGQKRWFFDLANMLSSTGIYNLYTNTNAHSIKLKRNWYKNITDTFGEFLTGERSKKTKEKAKGSKKSGKKSSKKKSSKKTSKN